MKKFFTQKINFAYVAIVTLVLTAGVSLASAQYASPGQIGDLNPLIHRGGGEQAVDELRLGDCPSNINQANCFLNGIGLDARGPAGAVSWFDNTATNAAFAVLQNSYFLGKLVIGPDTATIWNQMQGVVNDTSGNPLNLLNQVQKVNVIGNTLATNLQNTSGTERVCVTNRGALVLCPDIEYYEYQCDYTTGSGQWQRPQYRAADGTDIGNGTIQGGLAVLDSCPVQTNYGRLNEYDSAGSYTTGDRVCSTSTPNHANCTTTPDPAWVCGGLNPGEWNTTRYGAMNCPYQDYSSSSIYAQGDIVCNPSAPDNGTCSVPADPAFLCQSDGTWSPARYGAMNCPYPDYQISVAYQNGDLVCADSIPPNNQCAGSSNGQCGSADGGTFSSAPSRNLCASGTASTVADNTTTGRGGTADYTWTCAGSNGGTTASCSANYQASSTNGQCANFPGSYSSQPANASNGCLAGSYQDETDTLTTWDWSCQGINGGLVAICDADRVSYSWDVGPWGTCSNGSQSRIVVCRDNNNNVVSNSLCGSPTPETSRNCLSQQCPGVFPQSQLPVSPGGNACVSDGQGGCDCQSYYDAYNVCPGSCVTQQGNSGSGSSNGSCGDACNSNSDCASGIFCWYGACDMYDTNNNGQADDFDGIC
ncbi:MAG: hypothetical protein MRY57_04035 [Candidatus Pacebacteria bacterium]|nr:hypothetical protein [Candidatus Paceibacterota bacterium]